jgi:hypothetical protein
MIIKGDKILFISRVLNVFKWPTEKLDNMYGFKGIGTEAENLKQLRRKLVEQWYLFKTQSGFLKHSTNLITTFSIYNPF